MKRLKVNLIRISVIFVVCLATFLLTFYFFFHGKEKLYDIQRISKLERENKILSTKLLELKGKIAYLETLIDSVYKKDVALRMVVGLECPPREVREMGMGGYLEEPPEPGFEEISKVELHLEKLIKLAEYEKESFSQIEDKLLTDKKRRDHTPSILPVSGLFTSGFRRRRDPFTGRISFHPGIDISAPTGTPIYAPADGIVRRVKWERGYGLVLEIDHGYGVVTRYAHNSKVTVRPGRRVKRGQIIAYVGNTGHSTGPHLHYEVIVYSKHVNPLKYIIPRNAYYD